MNWGGPTFMILIVALSMGAWVITTWIRAKHGIIEDEDGNERFAGDPAAGRKIELLTNENEKLHGQVGRLDERIAVLERIATDKPSRLSAEIDNLR